MTRTPLATCISRALACSLPLLPCIVLAAPGPAPSAAGEPKQLDAVVVQADIAYRNRSGDIEPTLVYDLEYFQRFEPTTVGDMLRRVPGVGFVGSDIMEYDGVQLRGLGGGYTQVLVNGRKVPGAGDDRSFYVDRIPAEMVDRIEIRRSASANRSGDAVAGAINIVLRDAWAFEGSYLRMGLNRWDDGEVNPTFGAVTSTDALGGRVLAGINVQDRYRSKTKRSDRYGDATRQEKTSWEDQVEVKDGRDYSANFSYVAEIGGNARFSADAFYVRTDRDVTEVSFEEELDGDEVEDKRVPGFNPYDQENWGASLEYRFAMAGGTTRLGLDHARFDNHEAETEGEQVHVGGADGWDGTWSIDGAEWDGTEYEAVAIDARDRETGLTLSHSRPLGGAELEFGLDLRWKRREGRVGYYQWEADSEDQPPPRYPADFQPDGTVGSTIEERRVDPYLMLSGRGAMFTWEAGLRHEATRSEVAHSADDGPVARTRKEYDELLPSVHLRWDLTEADRINLSLARTLKRPDFNALVPAVLEGEFGDNDYVGNPALAPETANGIDLGYEHRLGRRGVVGINFFYRDVRDLVELVNTGEPSEAAVEGYEDDIADLVADGEYASAAEAMAANPFQPDSWLFTSANVGDGEVYGFEFDLSAPLSFVGLEHTGVFLNYAWVDSRVDDFAGRRRFNDQARSTFNVGFIQDLPALDASFGLSYRKQGDARSRLLGEEALVRYGGELDAFVEKRFGDRISLRLSASNLLDASKDEVFDKFDTAGDQLARDYDEYELETEEAGPSYQLVMRWAF
jgi:Outer membrane receptor proteins, mostly Fe transport